MSIPSFTDRPFGAPPRRKSRRLEQDIQRAVFAHLAARPNGKIFAFHCPNGGLRSKSEAAIMKGLGVRAGVPDVIVIKDGQTYALELKAPQGRGSAAQSVARAELHFAGAMVAEAVGLDAAILQLEQWGILRGKANLASADHGPPPTAASIEDVAAEMARVSS